MSQSVTQVRLEVRERVAWVTLDGAESLNSLTPDVLTGLEWALDTIEQDDVRVLVITGAGKVFSVGMDIDYLGECFADPAGVFVPFTHRLHALLERLEALPIPVIAAVNGLARAGGFELMLACDLVVASERAKVADHHIEFGIVPGAGATIRAARKMGDMRARELLYTGRWLVGQELVEAGLAIKVATPEALLDVTGELATGLAARSGACLASMKQLVTEATEVTLAEGLERERLEFARFHAEVEGSDEGYRAWVEKRDPVWN